MACPYTGMPVKWLRVQRKRLDLRMARKASTLLVLVTLLFASTAMLQGQGIDLFLQGGASSLMDKNSPSTVTGPFQTSYATGGQFSLGAEARLGSLFGLEGAYGWGQNNLRVAGSGSNSGIQASYGIRHQRASGDFVLHAPFPILKPYLLAGIEYDHFSPYGNTVVTLPGISGSLSSNGSPVLSSDNELGFNYGGGVELGVLPFVGFRIDIRDHVTSSPSFGLQGRYNTTAHDVEYSAGIVIHVGK